MSKNIFAYTAPGSDYPEFLSINETDGKISISGRGTKPSETIGIPFPVEQLAALRDALTAYLGKAEYQAVQ